jgi:hypothetical protein
MFVQMAIILGNNDRRRKQFKYFPKMIVLGHDCQIFSHEGDMLWPLRPLEKSCNHYLARLDINLVQCEPMTM